MKNNKPISFKEKTLKNIIISAKAYHKLLGKTFILRSNKFKYRKEYKLVFYDYNFLHLTGVKTSEPTHAKEFYWKAYRRKLKLDDFNFGENNFLKHRSRRKLRYLKNVNLFFNNDLIIKERFIKGKVYCDICLYNGKYILGFVGKKILKPRTLLDKNYVNGEYVCIKKTKIILMKSRNKTKKLKLKTQKGYNINVK